jgi:cytochrome c-type biogenesis protein
MSGAEIPIGLAFVAGVASFVSPCVFSLVPAYVGYLSSRAVTADGQITESRWGTLAHGVAFVLGFSLVFVLLGLGASAIGQLLYDSRDILMRVGGIVVIIFGLHTMGVIHIPLLEYDTRRQQAPDRRLGYLSSILMGVFFSAGWAPCVGPVLGTVLTMAASSGVISRGAVLLTAYSLGLGIPFLLAAVSIGSVSNLLRRFGPYLRYVSVATGALLIFIGVLLLTNQLSFFARVPLLSELQTSIDQGVIATWQNIFGGR